MGDNVRERLKVKLARFINDYYMRFDDNRVEFYIDDMRYNYFLYGIDETTSEPDTNIITSYGSVQINEDMTVTTSITDYIKHYHSVIVYDTWNDFIDYMEDTCDWTEMLYMYWDSYKLS